MHARIYVSLDKTKVQDTKKRGTKRETHFSCKFKQTKLTRGTCKTQLIGDSQ